MLNPRSLFFPKPPPAKYFCSWTLEPRKSTSTEQKTGERNKEGDLLVGFLYHVPEQQLPGVLARYPLVLHFDDSGPFVVSDDEWSVAPENEAGDIGPVFAGLVATSVMMYVLSENYSVVRRNTPKGKRIRLSSGGPLNIVEATVENDDVRACERILTENDLEPVNSATHICVPSRIIFSDNKLVWKPKETFSRDDFDKLDPKVRRELLEYACKDKLSQQHPALAQNPELLKRLLSEPLNSLFACSENHAFLAEEMIAEDKVSDFPEITQPYWLFDRLQELADRTGIKDALHSIVSVMEERDRLAFSDFDPDKYFRNQSSYIVREVYALLGRERRSKLLSTKEIPIGEHDRICAIELYLILTNRTDLLSLDNEEIDFEPSASDIENIGGLAVLVSALRNQYGVYDESSYLLRSLEDRSDRLLDDLDKEKARVHELEEKLRAKEQDQTAAKDLTEKLRRELSEEKARSGKVLLALEHEMQEQIYEKNREIQALKRILSATNEMMAADEEDLDESGADVVLIDDERLIEELPELPDEGVIFVGGHTNLQKKLRQKHPYWIYLDNVNFSGDGKFDNAKVVFMFWKHLSHKLYYRSTLFASHAKGDLPIVYVSSTNLDLLEDEMRRGYAASQADNT